MLLLDPLRRIIVSLALGSLCGSASCTTVTNETSIASGKTFDYIIAGAGLSGLTVGNKLSAKGYAVLIIEAGPDASWNPEVYEAEGRAFGSKTCNWQYPAYGDDGKPLLWKVDSGACIGGGTSINGMVWYRPTKAELDKLEALGNRGWNWDNLEPYMVAAERNIPPDASQIAQGAGSDPDAHGHSGFVNTSFPTPLRIPKAVALYKEALPLVFPGLAIGDDLSNRTAVSSATSMYTIWHDPVTGKNRRSSAADGYLWPPSQQRATLTVLATHKVDRVLFGHDLTAAGVVFLPTNGSVPSSKGPRVYATKGVILSAGSLATSAILERSGVGDPGVLKAAGIKRLVDLPGVGAHLNDQPGTAAYALVSTAYQNDASIIDNRSLFAPEISLINVDELWPLTAASRIRDIASARGLRSRAQSLVDARAAANILGAEAVLNATIDLIITHRLPIVEFLAESGGPALYAAFWPLMPLSRGHVHINSSSPLHHPIITPRLLQDPFDAAIAVSVARASRAVFASAPFGDVVADAYYDPPIGANGTDAEYLAWYRQTMIGASHWVGATAMMPRHLGGVVNPQLRVYGTSKLHVVDAGILPFQVTAHMMSTLYAVAGRAADVIMDCQ
ncbi:GMC oxidoreductase [Podospora didyma]|uniref:GMC oxidoreductase n=1 Tax=Podospora didyma TaxID=330526 RepID=A0AAE0K4I2_9PEZI|nr:GMC oxidoreductase [Podospora didyma]